MGWRRSRWGGALTALLIVVSAQTLCPAGASAQGPVADLAITKTDGVTSATPGGSVTYTITVSNAGPSNASGTTVADTFPAVLTATWTCVGAGGGTCTASGSGNINDTVNLPAGGSVTYTASASIASSATGTLSNTATTSTPGGVTDPTPGNNSATDTDTLTAAADLAITKTDGVTSATPGGSVTYTITASNAGPSNAPGASVADTFPAVLTATWTCVGAGGGTCTASGAGNINDTVNLPAGGSVTYTASAQISPSATGTLSNTATVSAPGGVTDPTPGNNSATDTDTLTPALVPPSITSSAGATFTVGRAGTFTLTATGNPTPSLSESGALPAGVTFTDNGDGTASVSGTPAAGTGGVYQLTITASNGVSPDATQSFTLTVQGPPRVTIATPSQGARYTRGQHVVSSFSCSEGAGGPGIKSCLDQNGEASGAAIDTSTPGQHTFTVTATSTDGLTAQSRVTYTVSNPAPSPPAVMRVRVPSLSVFGRTGSRARCRMDSGVIRACSVKLLRRGRVLARGRASASGPGARAVSVRLRLTRRGRALLAGHLGGVRGRVRATAATSGGTRSVRARTRAVLAVEHFVTPPGSWLPNQAALSGRGRHFLRSRRVRLVAVAAIRCDGYSAKVRAHAPNAKRISLARAALACAALRHRGVRTTLVGHGDARPIASNATAAGRARNRRVEITITHRHTRR